MAGKQLAVVEQAVSVLHKVKEYIANGMESTISICTEMIEQEKDGPNVKEKRAEMEDIMLRYANSDRELQRFMKASDHAIAYVKNGGDLEFMENELDNKLKELKEAEKGDKLKDHTNFQEMTSKIEDILHSATAADGNENEEEIEVDGDLAIKKGTVNTKCPYTGKEMTRPVKNKHCGHYYDRAGIEEMCKKRSKPKCPIPGCVNDKAISMADVSDDPKMKQIIDAKNRKKTKRK